MNEHALSYEYIPACSSWLMLMQPPYIFFIYLCWSSGSQDRSSETAADQCIVHPSLQESLENSGLWERIKSEHPSLLKNWGCGHTCSSPDLPSKLGMVLNGPKYLCISSSWLEQGGIWILRWIIAGILFLQDSLEITLALLLRKLEGLHSAYCQMITQFLMRLRHDAKVFVTILHWSWCMILLIFSFS